MRRLLYSIALVVYAALSVLPTIAETNSRSAPRSILEKIEWTWAAQPDDPDPALPNVLLLGDSITRGYYPEVAKLLSGRANCYLFATSAAAGDPRLIAQVNDYFAMMPLRFSVIHFNNGMHGWKYTEAAYMHSLPALVETLQAKSHANLVWATTTPVQANDTSGATNQRIDKRNAAALRIMERFKISIDDQHGLMAAHGSLHNGNVHYTPEGSTLQGQQAAHAIEAVLPDKKNAGG